MGVPNVLNLQRSVRGYILELLKLGEIATCPAIENAYWEFSDFLLSDKSDSDSLQRVPTYILIADKQKNRKS